MIFTGNLESFTVRTEGTSVVLIVNGRRVATVPYEQALQISAAIRSKAKEAEARANVDNTIADQAILTRLGVPVGLTSDPAVAKIAANEAAWNSKLRRYIRPSRAAGIESGEMFLAPVIKVGKPNE